MNPEVWLLPAALVAAAALTVVARHLALRWRVLDVPNERSLHARPIPRGGGIGLVAAFLAIVAWEHAHGRVLPGLAWALLLGGSAVALLGVLDDVARGLPNRVRMAVWVPVAVFAVWAVGGLPGLDLGLTAVPLGLAGSALAVVGIVWMANLYNFMDGSDGFAGTQAVMVAGAGAALLIAGGHHGFAFLAAALAASSAGFLVWNWPPARVFMGDVGSTFLGFTFAVLAIATENAGAMPVALWAILMGVFLVDTLLTLARRVRRGEKWYTAHRTHAYQHAVAAGHSHRAVVLGLVGVNTALVALAAAAWSLPAALPLASLVAVVGLILLWRHLTQPSGHEGTGQPMALRRASRLPPLRVTPARRLLFFVGGDVAIIAASTVAAFALRFDGVLPEGSWPALGFVAALATLATVGALAIYGIYRVSWNHVGLRDVVAIGAAVGFGALLLATVAFLWQNVSPLTSFPRGVVPMEAALGFLGIAGFRLWKRARRLFQVERARAREPGVPTLLVGAGEAGEQLLQSILDAGPRSRYRVVGFLDDDPLARNTSLHGVAVWGSVGEMGTWIERLAVEAVIICISTAEGPFIREVVRQCRRAGVGNVRVVPPLSQVLDGRVTLDNVKEVSLEDLLGREMVNIRQDEVSGLLRRRTVVVTGGAGTIGSELCRQVAKFQPSKLVVLDLDETRLHDTALDLRERNPGVEVHEALGDVRRRSDLDALFAKHRPEVVFHAAAMKHVPMMEHFPLAALEVNVLGTASVLEAAEAHGAERFVLISTDKAVEPSNVMGASKRLAEMVLLTGKPRSIVRSAVRFGNVIGSRGSVIPTFERQVQHGGPLTVTHPDVERFFMMTSEAVSLVLQAAALGKGGDVFILDMGKPVRILDVAREFCRLKGLEPGVDVPIVFTGLRPGEKLTEVLSYPEETLAPTTHTRVLRTDARADGDAEELLARVRKVVAAGDAHAARRFLRERFPRLDAPVAPLPPGLPPR